MSWLCQNSVIKSRFAFILWTLPDSSKTQWDQQKKSMTWWETQPSTWPKFRLTHSRLSWLNQNCIKTQFSLYLHFRPYYLLVFQVSTNVVCNGSLSQFPEANVTRSQAPPPRHAPETHRYLSHYDTPPTRPIRYRPWIGAPKLARLLPVLDRHSAILCPLPRLLGPPMRPTQYRYRYPNNPILAPPIHPQPSHLPHLYPMVQAPRCPQCGPRDGRLRFLVGRCRISVCWW